MLSENRRIILNVCATYGRSVYALAVGLFSARWVLQALGVVDYGIFGLIGGLTFFISYLNGIVGGAVGRFYAVAVGKESVVYEAGLAECRMWFTTAVFVNTVIPVALVVCGYPIGVYAIRHWLVIPGDKIAASIWVWRFVCASCFVGMVNIPFQAMYVAKQLIAELTIYSFVSTTCNAIIVYYMASHANDWLVHYSFWHCLVVAGPMLIIAVRAVFVFKECRIVPKFILCWKNIREVGSFGLWTSWGGFGTLLSMQGQALLVNRYFGPKVNAAFTVGTNLSGQCNTLAGSMIGAFSPAIYNAWGAGMYERARQLATCASKFGTLFVMLFALPLSLEIREVLAIWLGDVPTYAAELCVCVLVTNIIDKASVGQMLTVNANGIVAVYQAFLGTALVATLPIGWLLIKCDVGPCSIGFSLIITMVICSIGRALLARRLVGMSARLWLCQVIFPLSLVALPSLAAGFLPRVFLRESVIRVVITTLSVEIVLLPLSWRVLLTLTERQYICSRLRLVLNRLKRVE